jgi:ABC-type transport system involved in Fe-S cluster assembly fused permease/ATPase subunit
MSSTHAHSHGGKRGGEYSEPLLKNGPKSDDENGAKNNNKKGQKDEKDGKDGKDEKNGSKSGKKSLNLDEILSEETAKSEEFLQKRENTVTRVWWLLLTLTLLSSITTFSIWYSYYEPSISLFSPKSFSQLIHNYNFRYSLSDLVAVSSLRSFITLITLLSTFSDEKRFFFLNSVSYWVTAVSFILSICKVMIISYSTTPTTFEFYEQLSTGQNVFRIILTISTVFISLSLLLLHGVFNPLNVELYEDDELQQAEFLKRQKLHHQRQEQAEIQSADLSGEELREFLKEQELLDQKYEQVEYQLKRARMTAKELEDKTTFSEFFWLLKPYFWPRGFGPKTIVFITWVLLIAARTASILAPLQIGHATDQLQNEHTVPWKYLTLFCGLTFLTNGLKQLQSIIFLRVKQSSYVELSSGLLGHILTLSLNWHHSKTLGKTTRSIDRGLSAAESVVSYLFLMLLPSAFEALTIFIIFFQKFKQPLISAIIFFHLSIYAISTVQLTIIRKPMRQKARAMDNKYHDIITDALQNVEILKLYNKETFEVDRYTRAIELYQSSTVATQATLSILNALQTFIIQLCLLLSLFVVGTDIAAGKLTIGTLSSMVAFMGNLFQPLSWLGSIYDLVVQAFIDASVVLEIRRQQPDVVEYTNAAPIIFTEAAPLIEFKNVTFHYEKSVGHGVHNINLTIPRGASIAIVGETGSGKSTLTKLLLRFYDPQGGQIMINGQDIKHVTNASLKESIIMVPQDTTLFNDTILNNIIYSHPNATHDEIIKACTIASILDFIVTLPLGFYTIVGERGLKLSGGQRQRINIARSTLKRFRGMMGMDTDVLLQPYGGIGKKTPNSTHNFPQTLQTTDSDLTPTPLLTTTSINGINNSSSTTSLLPSSTTVTSDEDHQILIKNAKNYLNSTEYLTKTKASKDLWGVGRIILTDEATSASDTITERVIQSAMRVLEEGATTIAITHRLTYVTHFDLIVVMSNGRIIEQGTHEELLSLNGNYALMYAQQFVKERITDIDSESLTETLQAVKDFTTNPLFAGKFDEDGKGKSRSQHDSKDESDVSTNNVTPVESKMDANHADRPTGKGDSRDNDLQAGNNDNNTSGAAFQATMSDTSKEELVEQAKKSLKMGHIFTKINNQNQIAARGRRH